jgi:anti-sigma B factor antagonist
MISIERRDKIDIISFTVDRINTLITDEIRMEIGKVFLSGSTRVILNLKDVKYIDSSGFGCLLGIMKAAKNSYCTLKFTSPEPSVMQVLKTLNLHTVFDIYEDLDECARSFK